MRVIKPAWVKHTDEKDRRQPIYSINVHPDGTRLATGGIDKRVKIWSTVPILDSSADQNEGDHKLLCTMSSHTGSVLAVRWAHHGRYLASGSDDTVVMIWVIDPDGGGRVFGSDEVNVENWKAVTRLVGHTADIIDIAWSRDDSMLATVGLDKLVLIWDGRTFGKACGLEAGPELIPVERLRKLDLHADFVKGVCWDPVGNFLATQSDDKTVKIWNTDTWELMKSVEQPFANSPKSTFFRRLSWSPDGAFIAASNAMNGPVFVAAVIEREGWRDVISFVGHENTIQVAAFNPRLFFLDGDKPGRATASTMVALGADDFSISIWRNTIHQPLVVLKDIFAMALMDLCWANDGHHLYGCSKDGTICAITFDSAELPEMADMTKTQLVLDEYNYQPTKRIARPMPMQPPSTNGFTAIPSSAQVNYIQPRKGKPKAKRIGFSNGDGTGLRPPLGPPNGEHHDAFSAAPIQPFGSPSTAQASTARMFQDAHAAFVNGIDNDPSRGSQKRKASLLGDTSPRARNRPMTSSQPRQIAQVRKIRAPRLAMAGSSSGQTGYKMPVPGIQTVLRAIPQDSDEAVYIEAHNAEDSKGKNKVIYCQDGQDQWIDFVPSAVVCMAISSRFATLGCEDGNLFVYSPAGRHLFSCKLESPACEMAARGNMLVVITADGNLRVLDIRTSKMLISPTTISHLVDATSNLVKLDIRPNGVPIIITSQPTAYAYNAASGSWITIASPWWFESDSTSTTTNAPTGPLSEVEQEIMAAWKNRSSPVLGEKPEWWTEAIEMGHLENRMAAATLLDSKEEYMFWLARYTVVLGREGFRARAEELVKELVGPMYSHGKGDWQATMMGMQKRDLALGVLSTLVQSPALSGFAAQWQSLLKVSAQEGVEWS